MEDESARPLGLGSDERLIGKPEWLRIGVTGLLEASVVLVFFMDLLKTVGTEQARSFAFTTLVLSQLWRSFGARDLRPGPAHVD